MMQRDEQRKEWAGEKGTYNSREIERERVRMVNRREKEG